MPDVWDTRNKTEGASLSKLQKPRSKELTNPYKKGPAFTISFKLTLAFLSLFLMGLSLMIYLASRSFNQETSARAQEHTLALSKSIGSQLEIKINSIREKAYFISHLALTGDPQAYAQKIFSSNANFIFLGIASSQEKGGHKLDLTFYNSEYMALNTLKKEAIDRNYKSHKQYIQKARENIDSVFNASLGQVPLVGLSFPLDSDRSAMLYIYPEAIFKIFEAHGSVNTYIMVDALGDIVAHKNPEIVLKPLNLSSDPIVKQMLESQTPSGQLRYLGRDNKNYWAFFQKLSLANLGLLAYLEEDRIFSSAYKLKEYNILISLMILLFALLFIYYFAKTLSVPIFTLGRAVKEVEQGHYDLKIKPAFRDEIGDLTKSFLHMSKVLKEREIEKDALLRSTNKRTAEADLEELKICGEKKYASISFIDLYNFKNMSKKMSTEDILSFLNAYFRRTVSCITRSGGVVDKYIGDSVMSHWSDVSGVKNETEAAIHAAINVRRLLSLFSDKLNLQHRQKNIKIRMTCGIHSGEVISGRVGSGKHWEHTLIGEAVHVASRLEFLNKALGTDILISHESYMRVRGKFKVEVMPPIRVKSSSKPWLIYAVLGPYALSDTPKNLDMLRLQLGIPSPSFDDTLWKQAALRQSA